MTKSSSESLGENRESASLLLGLSTTTSTAPVTSAGREKATHAYVGYCPICNACYAASVDAPEYARENAKFVSGLLRRGARVERITIEEVRKGMSFCDHRKKKKPVRGRSQFELGVGA